MVAIAIGAALLLCGTLMYRHLVRNVTADTDGQSNKPPTSAEEQIQAISDTARLYSFFWSQSHSNAYECFVFSFGATQWNTESDGHYLNCEFRTSDGEFIEHRDVPVSNEQWVELEDTLRGLSLPPYSPPDPNLTDAANSCVEICWTDDGNRFTNRCNGEYADKLRAFILTFIEQITRQNNATDPCERAIK